MSLNSSDPSLQEMPPGVLPERPSVNSSLGSGGAGGSREGAPARLGFAEDFQRFFLRGLAALMPTLITLWLLVWVWDFLWMNVGRHIVLGIRWAWMTLSDQRVVSFKPPRYIYNMLDDDLFRTRVLGVVLAVLTIYIVGVFVGNLLGRTMWRLAEHGVMKVPVLRGVYPAVKQITDFVLSEKTDQFQASKVVAVEPHAKGIWSIGLVTGSGLRKISDATGQEMVTVFVPSSPTAFSGYVLVVPKSSVIELPLKVEEAMRLLVSGGVISPGMGTGVGPAGGAVVGGVCCVCGRMDGR
jgi:uncharacterized membrane protein